MKRCAIAILLVLSLSSLCAAEKQFEPARIVSVEKKFYERVLYYLVNTPVTQDDPYYETSVKLGDCSFSFLSACAVDGPT